MKILHCAKCERETQAHDWADYVICESCTDHIIPKSKGGTHDLSNLRWALKLENRAKGNLSDKEFISLCSDVSKFFGGA
jgi:ribosomal protein S27E